MAPDAREVPDVEHEDALYGLGLDDFTAARNALVKRLKQAGEKDRAATTGKLRRPALTAWALNQVARHESPLVAEVFIAGDALREAMDAALAGDASGVRSAQAAERDAVEAAVIAAVAHLADAGSPGTDDARWRMSQTVRAALVDDDAADRLRRGTMVVDIEASGFGTFGFGEVISAPGRAKKKAPSAAAALVTPTPAESLPVESMPVELALVDLAPVTQANAAISATPVKAVPASRGGLAAVPDLPTNDDDGAFDSDDAGAVDGVRREAAEAVRRDEAEAEAAAAARADRLERRRAARDRAAMLVAGAERLAENAERLQVEADEAAERAEAAREIALVAEREAADALAAATDAARLAGLARTEADAVRADAACVETDAYAEADADAER